MNAKRRVRYVQDLLDQVGVGRERLEMYNMSSAEGPRFAEVAVEMTERVRALGPSPVRGGKRRPQEQVDKEEVGQGEKVLKAV